MSIYQGLINMARDEAKYTVNEFPLKAKLFSDMADAMERLLAEVAALKAEPDIEALAERVHRAWLEEKLAQGYHAPHDCPYFFTNNVTGRHCELCHPDMIPYDELTEANKDYDRVTVRAVLAAMACS